MSEEVLLLLGSNEGDRYAMLEYSKVAIQKKEIGNIITCSTIYETDSWGLENLPKHLNQVLIINTTLTPFELLEKLQHIEQEIGRERVTKWGQRKIDIDILYYGQRIVQENNLTIPHPFLHQRRFALVPLIEVAPEWLHPIFLKTNKELLFICPDKLAVDKWEKKS